MINNRSRRRPSSRPHDIDPLEPRRLLASVVYVNDDWTIIADTAPPGLSPGDTVSDPASSISNKTFAQDAFASIAAAIASVDPNGAVNLLPGTYQESDIAITKPLTIDGDPAASNRSLARVVPALDSATTGGTVDPSAGTTGEKGTVSFAWTPAAIVSNELRISVEGATTVIATALDKPSFTANAVVNAASFAAGITPGSFASIFGVNLAGGSTTAARVIVNTRSIIPVFISEGQLNFLMPDDIAEGTADVSVTTPVGASSTVQVTSAAISPGIFFDVASGLGAILYNATDSKILEIYATGLGPLRADGSGLLWTKETVEAIVAGNKAEVIFSGQAPGYPGLYQVNARVPSDMAAGLKTLVLRVGSKTSNEVKVQVR